MYLFEIHEFVIIRSGKSKNLRFLAGILGDSVPYRLSPCLLYTSSPARCLALGATLSLCAILRHNGMAMALAAGAWLLIALPQRWKRILPALLIAVLMTLRCV